VQGGPTFETAEQASQYLIREMSMVTVPWQEGGPYLRFSATYVAEDEAAEDALMAETLRRLTAVKLMF
jgi:LL-diaminopimelate aminotransferase